MGGPRPARWASRWPATCWPGKRSCAKRSRRIGLRSNLPFADRLITALERGEAAGGDKRGQQSAAIKLWSRRATRARSQGGRSPRATRRIEAPLSPRQGTISPDRRDARNASKPCGYFRGRRARARDGRVCAQILNRGFNASFSPSPTKLRPRVAGKPPFPGTPPSTRPA